MEGGAVCVLFAGLGGGGCERERWWLCVAVAGQYNVARKAGVGWRAQRCPQGRTRHLPVSQSHVPKAFTGVLRRLGPRRL